MAAASSQSHMARLIREAQETRSRTELAINELKQVTAEVRESVAYLRWWRFLGFDANVSEFLLNLDSNAPQRGQ